MSEPQISIIIPTHNHKKWVVSAIASIAEQKLEPDNLIIVDDGSSDETYEFLKERFPLNVAFFPEYDFSLKFDILRNEKPQGPAAARNLGIKHCWDKTDLFFFLDSDDYYEPDKISESVRKWKEAPDLIGCVYSDYFTVNSAGLKLLQFKEPYSRERLLQECLPNCDSLISKQAFEAAGLFDESLRVCEDLDLWLRISEKLMLVHIPNPLVNIRIGEHSSSSTIKKEQWVECHNRVYAKLRQRNGG